MKNSDLEKYKKIKSTASPKETTSVFLEKRQTDFIKKRQLNLSKLVRDFIDRLMRETEK